MHDDYADQLQTWHEDKLELRSAKEVADRGFEKYLKSRQGASVESVKRAKRMAKSGQMMDGMGAHPVMMAGEVKEGQADMAAKREDFLERMRNFRPQSVI